jgi:hypothetical protein
MVKWLGIRFICVLLVTKPLFYNLLTLKFDSLFKNFSIGCIFRICDSDFIKASGYNANWNLLKSGSVGGKMGPQLGKIFLHKLILEYIFSPKPEGQFQSNLVQIIIA